MCQFLQDEQGTAAVEYSLLITLITLVIAGAFHALGVNLVDALSSINRGFPSVQVIEDTRSSGLLEKS